MVQSQPLSLYLSLSIIFSISFFWPLLIWQPLSLHCRYTSNQGKENVVAGPLLNFRPQTKLHMATRVAPIGLLLPPSNHHISLARRSFPMILVPWDSIFRQLSNHHAKRIDIILWWVFMQSTVSRAFYSQTTTTLKMKPLPSYFIRRPLRFKVYFVYILVWSQTTSLELWFTPLKYFSSHIMSGFGCPEIEISNQTYLGTHFSL